jgi:transcriptional regulator with XRE-family HTH domain
MHEFYERVQKVFKNAGSNRNQFCKKRGYNYQTLQAYWNTDRLPSGKVLEDLAKEYHVSIDALVLGRSSPDASGENPTLDRIVQFLKKQDVQTLLRIDGALQMFGYLALSGAKTPAPEEIMPEKMEKASSLLAELAQLIRQSDMNEEKKKAAEQMVSKVIMTIYEREVKDEWAELQEVD